VIELEDFEYDEIMYQLQRALELVDRLEKRGYCCGTTKPQAKEDFSMGQISNITVRASDGIKTADYAPPKLYDITAIIIPTDDDNVDQLLTDTLARINRAGQAYLTGRVTAPAATGGSDPAAVEETPATPRRKRRTAAEIAADEALARAAHPKGETPKDPAAVGDDDFQIEGETPAEGGEDDFAIEPETADEEITDAALNAAVQRKNAELSDPEAIRGLIKQYNPDPTKAFQLREIPQTKRAEFITKLGGLTKASA
jgi:hypothetical protein